MRKLQKGLSVSIASLLDVRSNMKQKAKPGDLLAVPVGDEWALARQLNRPMIEFFDVFAPEREQLSWQKATSLAPIFRVWVMDRATKSRRWKLIGHEDLVSPRYGDDQEFFKFDRIAKSYSIYYRDSKSGEMAERPASKEECLSLECAAVWDPEHVESRLLDFRNGRSNKWVESLRP